MGKRVSPYTKRVNGHKSDIKNHNVQKPVRKHFNLPGHSDFFLSDLYLFVCLAAGVPGQLLPKCGILTDRLTKRVNS